ncbi:hypothetical protein C8J56DRAFT_22504 [Mycena floridula]|nr:hypothetical protein C8J56DRAFT_22504 [Mycena floridula]
MFICRRPFLFHRVCNTKLRPSLELIGPCPPNSRSNYYSAAAVAATIPIVPPTVRQNGVRMHQIFDHMFSGAPLPISSQNNAAAMEVDVQLYAQTRAENSLQPTNSLMRHLRQISPNIYLSFFRHFARTGSPGWAMHVVSDIIGVCDAPRIDRITVCLQIISETDFAIFTTSTVLHLVKFLLNTIEGFTSFQHGTLEILASKVCHQLKPGKADLELLALLCPLLLSKIGRTRAPEQADAIGYTPVPIIEVAFDFIIRLIKADEKALALDIFQALVDHKFIPLEAMRSSGAAEPEDFELIVISTLIRTSLHWHQRTIAMRMLTNLIQLKGSQFKQKVTDIASLTMLSCLDTPLRPELFELVKVIREVHSTLEPVPDSVIRRFYQEATPHNTAAAVQLYLFTREFGVLCRHNYPAPQKDAIIPVMEGLADRGFFSHARSLVAQVVEGDIFLPPNDSARFILSTLQISAFDAAHVLWTRYADSGNVQGSASLMVRMVDAFMHLSQVTALDETLSVEQRHIRSQEYKDFAKHVLAEFRALQSDVLQGRSDINHVSHHKLNALARAYTIIGDGVETFRIFESIMTSKVVPDLVDINVAICYFAERSPRAAARIIEVMIQKGIQPNGKTFGTVLHHAALAEDTQLVSDLLGRASLQPRGDLTLKTIGSLLRAALAPGSMPLEPAARKARLETALEILDSMGEVRHLSSPTLGKYTIFMALRAGEPMLAYEFWKRLIRGKLGWEEKNHIVIRRMILSKVSDPEVVNMMNRPI